MVKNIHSSSWTTMELRSEFINYNDRPCDLMIGITTSSHTYREIEEQENNYSELFYG